MEEKIQKENKKEILPTRENLLWLDEFQAKIIIKSSNILIGKIVY